MKNSKNNSINLDFSFMYLVSVYPTKKTNSNQWAQTYLLYCKSEKSQYLHKGLKSIYLMLFLFSLEAEFSQNLFRNILKLKVALYKSCKNAFLSPKLLLYSFYPTFLFILLSLNYLINIWQMVNLDIDDLAVKPYIPHQG